jgi:hypothetical protein
VDDEIETNFLGFQGFVKRTGSGNVWHVDELDFALPFWVKRQDCFRFGGWSDRCNGIVSFLQITSILEMKLGRMAYFDKKSFDMGANEAAGSSDEYSLSTFWHTSHDWKKIDDKNWLLKVGLRSRSQIYGAEERDSNVMTVLVIRHQFFLAKWIGRFLAKLTLMTAHRTWNGFLLQTAILGLLEDERSLSL